MITLNDYLYSGDTIPKILLTYITDLRKNTHSWPLLSKDVLNP